MPSISPGLREIDGSVPLELLPHLIRQPNNQGIVKIFRNPDAFVSPQPFNICVLPVHIGSIARINCQLSSY